MPSLEFFVVASAVSLDQRTNRLSVLEIIEDLEPVAFPAHLPRVAALAVWTLTRADQGQDYQASLRVTGQIPEGEFRQNFRGDGPTQRMAFNLVNVPVLAPGTITFEISLNGDRVATHQIRVAPADASATDDGFLIYPGEAREPEPPPPQPPLQ